MADRRMLARTITENDNFVALPAAAQALYMHLTLGADDDGFCNQISTAMFRAHAKKKDLDALINARYLLRFDNGVTVIKHWRMANAIRKDRYTPTVYQEEAARLSLKENGAYTLATSGCQTVANPQPQVRLGKDRLGKDSLEENINTTHAHARDEDEPDRFEEFWAAYPKKSGDIRGAYFEYVGVIQSGVLEAEIIQAVKNQAAAKETQYFPSAEKWLRNKGWTEKVEAPKNPKEVKKDAYGQRDYGEVDVDALKNLAAMLDKGGKKNGK